MRKLAVLLTLTLASLGMIPLVAAQAACNAPDCAQATISASVSTVVSISFTDAASSFGALSPGTTTTDADTFTYTVYTNAVNGFHVNVATNGVNTFPNGVAFIGRTSTGPFNDAVNGTNSGVANNWRTTAVAGQQTYSDSVRIILPANQGGGALDATLNYTAIINP